MVFIILNYLHIIIHFNFTETVNYCTIFSIFNLYAIQIKKLTSQIKVIMFHYMILYEDYIFFISKK